MNCRDFMHQVDEYLEGGLDASELEHASAHLQSCHLCRQRVSRIKTLRAALRDLPVPEPRHDLLNRTIAPAPPAVHRRPRWPYAAGGALAASLALWLGFGWLPDRDAAGMHPAVTITLHQPRTVQLAFNAEQELRAATLRIQLPDGVELDGFPGQREIRWQTDIARGVNMLSLPLVAVSSAGGAMSARLEYGERATELIVSVRVAVRARTGALPRACDGLHGCRLSAGEVIDATA